MPIGDWVRENKCLAISIATSVATVTGILIITLVSLSFHYVEYNEYAIRKDTTTGVVDSSFVYESGRYYWGLKYTPIKIQKTNQNVDFTNDGVGALSVFTSDGLQLTIECSFQFRVIKDEIPALFQKFGISYMSSVINLGRSHLKNVAPNFTTDQYYTSRTQISQAFFNALKTGLEAEVNVEVVAFQLRLVVLSSQVSGRLLQTIVQEQINAKEQFLQNATLIRKETETLRQTTLSNITVISAQAKANASLIIEQAEAQALSTRLQSKETALASLFTTLDIQSPQLKLTFLYASNLGARDPKTQTTNVFLDFNNINLNVAP